MSVQQSSYFSYLLNKPSDVLINHLKHEDPELPFTHRSYGRNLLQYAIAIDHPSALSLQCEFSDKMSLWE